MVNVYVRRSCTNGKINFREKEKEVLDQILGPGRYDARIRPSGVNGTDGPAIVRVNLFVRSIATISDIKMMENLIYPNQISFVIKIGLINYVEGVAFNGLFESKQNEFSAMSSKAGAELPN
ncbi:hypothetical protein NQ315_010276 [Exocentrus adspersus]|uniref:Uncharacterized protein n=1 Tax=Exocentrus adspersus TaxID=1586481 RepID=A0AAV8WAP5_9CUCU|nr:hypothetical protein NQ315_010276 [Exocentrus adspersus]